MAHELLVEITRNGTVESQHFGSAVVCDYKGSVLEQWGDVDQLVFPRSALKPMLAINVVESGASDHFALDDAELALACASHQGEAMHTDKVSAWLGRLGLHQDHLACGAALPDDLTNAHNLLASGKTGCRIHHNCSGKHAGFLTTCLHQGLSLENYHLIGHPVQKSSLETLSDLAGVDIRQYPAGIDGCGFPAPTMPLFRLGHAIARFAKPSVFSNERSQAIRRLHSALIREPLYAAGHGTVVSELNSVTNGAVLAKTGAEGVLIAALPKLGLGIALKIADGNARARPTAMLAILNHLGIISDHEKSHLKVHINPPIKNSLGLVIGENRPATPWVTSLKNHP